MLSSPEIRGVAVLETWTRKLRLVAMARRVRLQYPGALYHVINRGNYRQPVFGTAGAAQSFLAALREACERHVWRVHAYALLPNHFHVALETPQANLVAGMHWLQSTFASRFNRFREERGHLFQGRYQALVVEGAAHLVRLVNYIHLNPVRAGLIPVSQLGGFRGSSMASFVCGSRPGWLRAADWLEQLGLTDSAPGWAAYLQLLAEAASRPRTPDEESGEFCTGCVIGSSGWRRTLAREHAHLALATGVDATELREIRERRWADYLAQALQDCGKCQTDLRTDRKGASWKIEIARQLRRQVGAPHRWIAETLHMGKPSSVRVYLCED